MITKMQKDSRFIIMASNSANRIAQYLLSVGAEYQNKNNAKASAFYDAIVWLIGTRLAYKIKNLKLLDISLNFYKIDEQFKLNLLIFP